MIYYTDADESILIGIYSVDKNDATIAKMVGKLLSYDLVQAISDEFEDVGDFEHDTVIVDSSEFVEEMVELVGKGVKVYLV